MKTLERKYSKIDRILCKAKFSSWVFVREIIIALILGGITAVLWIFAAPIETFFTKAEEVAFLTDWVFRWVVVGIVVFTLLCLLLEYIKLHAKEMILTEDKIVIREGVISVFNVTIPITEIKIVETKQNFIQRLIRVGSLVIVSDAEKPYTIKGIKQPDRLSRRIMKQLSDIKKDAERKVKIQLSGSTKN